MRSALAKTVAAAVVAAAMAGTAGVRAEGSSGPAQSGVKVAGVAPTGQTAATYFDRARTLGFPVAGQNAPYVLKAEFTTRGSSGVVETGTYTDTWVSDRQWRREATLGKSVFARSRNNHKLYRLADGPDAALLQFVLTAMEPLPATDAMFNERDWRITQDTVDGVATTRVASGKEKDGVPDPKEFYGFWFDADGQLVKSYGNGLETRRSEFEDYNGVKVARRVEIRTGGKVGMRIDVTEVRPAGKLDPHMFPMKGHEWDRAYTFEVR
jgi:hypothetical protein